MTTSLSERLENNPDVRACTKSFEAYYGSQIRDTFESEEEYSEFLEHLRRPLPVTFRVNRMRAYEKMARKSMKIGIPLLRAAGAKERSWCCECWELPCDRRTLRERGTDVLNELHKWMRKNESLGIISRQELVSMVPVLFLGVTSGHRCLDMCAAPGSKTTQLIELVQGRRKDFTCERSPSPGLVVANDFSARRAAILSHRCRRRVGACDRLMVVNHKAQQLPWFASVSKESRYPAGIFDRIVCDVPCTGDGAIRKTPELWRYWQPHLGLELHSLQLQIAMRAAALLAVGGKMAYSTCSLNPIENEAVVAALLRQTGGALELVDTSETVPELKRRPGLTTWTVMDDELRAYANYDVTQRRNSRRVPRRIRKRFRRTMFPPSCATEALPLRRCMRLYPHLQNTGGFFVAILRKVSKIPGPAGKSRKPLPSSSPSTTTNPTSPFFSVPRSVAIAAADAAGLDGEALWKAYRGCLFGRSKAFRRIFYISDAVRDLCIDGAVALKIRPVFCGVLVLERVRHFRAEETYEIAQEGLHIVLPHLRRNRKIVLSSRDFSMFLGWRGDYAAFGRERNVAIPEALENQTCVVVDPLGRAIVARCYVVYEDDDSPPREDSNASQEPVATISDVGIDARVLAFCNSADALTMSSKQLMDAIFRDFGVRTKQLREILGGMSVGTFLEGRRVAAETEKERERKRKWDRISKSVTSTKSLVQRRRVRVLRPRAPWTDRQFAAATT